MVTRTSNEERRNVVQRFYDRVVEGLPADPSWVDGMIEASSPSLPPASTPEQLEAWVELEGILADPSFLACRRANAADVWAPRFGGSDFLDAQYAALSSVKAARERGVDATSAEARGIVDALATQMAKDAGGRDPREVRAHLREKYDPRGARYWELVAIVRADAEPQRFDDWRWLGQALAHHGDQA